jgi:hypothetical protein
MTDHGTAGLPPIEIDNIERNGAFTIKSEKGTPQTVRQANKLVYKRTMYKLHCKSSSMIGFVARGVNNHPTSLILLVQDTNTDQRLVMYEGPPEKSLNMPILMNPVLGRLDGARQILITPELIIFLETKTKISKVLKC